MPPPMGGGGTPGAGAPGAVGVNQGGGACPSPQMEGAESQTPRASSSGPQGLQTQDWVCEPPSAHRSSHWILDMEERRQLALSSPSPDRSLLQTVAWLMSDGVDKDVLLPCTPRRPRPAEGPSASSWRRRGALGSSRS